MKPVLALVGLWGLALGLTSCGEATQTPTAPASLATPAAPSTTAAAQTRLAELPTTAAATKPAFSPADAVTTSVPSTTVAQTTASVTTSAGSVKAAQLPNLAEKAIRFSKTVGDLQLDIAVTPGKIGNNTFLARLSMVGSEAAVTDARLVQVNATMLDMDMGVAKLELKPTDPALPGIYQGQGYLMSMYGKYRLDLLVQRPGQPDATLTFEASVTSSK